MLLMRMRGGEESGQGDSDHHKHVLVTVEVSSLIWISRYSYSYRCGKQLDIR
jgi:hypothetical protein